MKRFLTVLAILLCIGQTFASEKSTQPLPTKVKFTLFQSRTIAMQSVANDVPIWEPGTLFPSSPPMAFLASGYKVTIYTVCNEPQIYDAMDYIALYSNDWVTINYYLYSEFDGYYEIGAP